MLVFEVGQLAVAITTLLLGTDGSKAHGETMGIVLATNLAADYVQYLPGTLGNPPSTE